MLEMVVDSVRVCPINNSPTLFLKGKSMDLFLPIFVGSAIADAIAAKLGSLSTARPLTHDLLSTVIDELGGSVQWILINDVRNNVAYAKVALQAKGELHQLDSRPGDAVALALRVRVPIYAEESVLDQAAWALDPETGALLPPDDDGDLSTEQSPPVTEDELERMSAFVELIGSLGLEDFD